MSEPAEPGPRRRDKYERLIARTGEIRAIPCAVAHPCDETSLAGAVDAARQGIIEPILVGPGRRIRKVAGEHGLDIAASRSSTRPTATPPPPRRSSSCAPARPSS
jgi:hypothetical protein